MSREADIAQVLDAGVQIPKTGSVNWDIPANANWVLLNRALKNKFTKNSGTREHISSNTLVTGNFEFTEPINGTCTNSDNASKVEHQLVINSVAYDGSNERQFELVQKSEVKNEANGIPRYNAEGHLVLPSGVEIW